MRKPTCSERVMRLEIGENAAIVSWYAEKSSAAVLTKASAAPPSRRCRPCSWNSAAGASLSGAATAGPLAGCSLIRVFDVARLLEEADFAVVLFLSLIHI